MSLRQGVRSVYNRYIGNTGKFYRVEDVEPNQPPQWEQVSPAPPPVPEQAPSTFPPPPVQPGPVPPPAPPEWEMPRPPVETPFLPPDPKRLSPEPAPLPPPVGVKKGTFDLGSMLNMPGSLRGTLMGWMPERLDLGDILLVLVLIYLFLEGDDDDMLIILGVLAFTWIWPLFKRGEE